MELWTEASEALLHRIMAAMVVVVFAVASIGFTAHTQARPAPSVPDQAFTELASLRLKTLKHCQKALLPGAISPCQISSGATSLPGSAPAGILPAFAARTLSWQMSNFRLPAQCGGPSPYRPPCLDA